VNDRYAFGHLLGPETPGSDHPLGPALFDKPVYLGLMVVVVREGIIDLGGLL
jgi:hypothetical protein